MTPNDTIKFNQVYLSIQCVSNCIADKTLFSIVDATRTYLKRVIADDESEWYPSMVIEWRVLKIEEGTQLLEHLDPGFWIAFEMLNIIDTLEAEPHAKYFGELESLWRSTAPRKVKLHHGKAHAYSPVEGSDYANGRSFPFQNTTFLDQTYNDSVKQAFVEQIERYDPDGLFRAGALERLLDLSNVTFDPRIANGLSCHANEDCSSRCCCNHFFCSFPLTKMNTCLQPSHTPGHICAADCECAAPLKCKYVSARYQCA